MSHFGSDWIQTIQPNSLAFWFATFQALARNSAEVIGTRGSSSRTISFAKSPGDPLRLKYVTEYFVPSRVTVMSLPATRTSSFGSKSVISLAYLLWQIERGYHNAAFKMAQGLTIGYRPSSALPHAPYGAPQHP